MPKAIVIVGPINNAIDDGFAPISRTGRTGQGSFAALDLLGAPLINRVVDDLKYAGVEATVIVADPSIKLSGVDPSTIRPSSGAGQMWDIASEQLARFRDGRAETIIMLRLGAYAEIDFANALQFHNDSDWPVVRGFDQHGPLDVWILDADRAFKSSGDKAAIETFRSILSSAEHVPYRVGGYINRLETPSDFRRLAVDGLNSRCRLRPVGFEIRPGVWMAEGAQVEREARIVGPAFIGKDVTISQQCLITRGSSIERNSFVDYGTVIEDTSVLPNSYVGIGLDVSHSIVDGDKLLNLQRGVRLRIEDSAVMRHNKPLGEPDNSWGASFGAEEPILPSTDQIRN